jgi:histidinol-phosphatase (PHP family)
MPDRFVVETLSRQYARYFELMRQLAASGLCDIIAHFDVVKRCGRHPTEHTADEITRTLQAIARAGISMEINTSGYRHPELPAPQPYPDLSIVKQVLPLGIPLTVNSDSHAPEQVGLKFAEMETYLSKQGCRTLARFDRRQRFLYDL